MLNRYFMHICLVLLFALTQMGIAMHSISHIEAHTQHSQPDSSSDKNTVAEHCGQCIAYAQADGGLPQYKLLTFADSATFELSTAYRAYLATASTPSFSARAPPLNLNLLA